MITETEAYHGFEDKASHAHKGKTPRNKVMFGDPGHWYTYFVYGVHWMLNIVTGPKDYPAAVLIRGVQGVAGPGRVSKELGVNASFNDVAQGTRAGLWIEDRGVRIPQRSISATSRVGVSYAKEWADMPFRFVLQQHQWIWDHAIKILKKALK